MCMHASSFTKYLFGIQHVLAILWFGANFPFGWKFLQWQTTVENCVKITNNLHSIASKNRIVFVIPWWYKETFYGASQANNLRIRYLNEFQQAWFLFQKINNLKMVLESYAYIRFRGMTSKCSVENVTKNWSVLQWIEIIQ